MLYNTDQILMGLLTEALSLGGIEVDVGGVEGGLWVHADINTVGLHHGRRLECDVQTNLVILEGYQRKCQSWSSVVEELERKEESLGDSGITSSLVVVEIDHSSVGLLLGLIHVDLREQSVPIVVVLIDLLATDLNFNLLHKLFGWEVRSVGGVLLQHNLQELGGDKVSVSWNGYGDALSPSDRS